MNVPADIVAATSVVRMSGSESVSARSALTVRTASPRTQQYMKSPSLYIGDLHSEVNEATLIDIFQAVGPIHSVRICRDRVSRDSLGYGYLNFITVEDAERALSTMNYYCGPQTFGRPVRLMWSMRDPSSRRRGVGNVFIKGLANTIDCKALYDTFSQFGAIWSCKVATDESGTSLGYGFVHFESPQDAQSAIANVDGMLLKGSKVRVCPFKRRVERDATGIRRTSYTNVYVKNLDDEHCSEEALRDLFKEYGEITSVFVPRNEDGSAKRYAFVNFASAEKAQQAVSEMHGRKLSDEQAEESERDGGAGKKCQKVLYVSRAQKKSERVAQLRKDYARMRRERAEKVKGRNVYVKNIGCDIDEQRLRAHFESVGTITSCAVMKDADGYSRGFGFVCFTTKEEAAKAVAQLNGALMNSKPLYVAIAQRKEERRAQFRAQHERFMPWLMAARGVPAADRMQPSPNYLMARPMYVQPNLLPHPHSRVPPIGSASSPVETGLTGPQPFVFPAYSVPGPHPRHVPQFSPPHHIAVPQPHPTPCPPSRTTGFMAYAYHTTRIHPANAWQPSAQTQPLPTNHTGRDVPQQCAAPHSPSALQRNHEPLTVEVLKGVAKRHRDNMLGVRLYPRVEAHNRALATKITGMLLELDDSDVLALLDNPEALKEMVLQGEQVLREHAESTAKQREFAHERADREGSKTNSAMSDPCVHKTENGSEK